MPHFFLHLARAKMTAPATGSTMRAALSAALLLILASSLLCPSSAFGPPTTSMAGRSAASYAPYASYASSLLRMPGRSAGSRRDGGTQSALFGTAASPPSPTASPAASPAAPSGPGLGSWIPLASASSLEGLDPVQIRVCGIDLAVFQDPGTGLWGALIDACPHRLAPLSQGRVDPATGCVECPYHGWQFGTDGGLASLPQLDSGGPVPSAGTSASASATSVPVHAAGDLLFAFLPASVTGESFPIDLIPEDQYPYLAGTVGRNGTYFSRDLPYSADFLLENFMDPAHIPYAHHGLQSVRDDGSPIKMAVLADNFTHIEVSFSDVSRGRRREGVLSFQRPALYHFRTRVGGEGEEDGGGAGGGGGGGGGYRPNLLIYVAPVGPGRCRILMPDLSLKWIPKWLGHAGSNRFLNTDTWLHDAERAARGATHVTEVGGELAVGPARRGKGPVPVSPPGGGGGLNYVYASRSDLGTTAFRAWWARHGMADAPPGTYGPAGPEELAAAGPALGRAEQIDPWVNHARHCSSCRRALRTMRTLQRLGLAAAAAGSVLLGRGRPAAAVAAALAGLWSYGFLGRLATVIEGNPRRAEIGYRSVAAAAADKKKGKVRASRRGRGKSLRAG